MNAIANSPRVQVAIVATAFVGLVAVMWLDDGEGVGWVRVTPDNPPPNAIPAPLATRTPEEGLSDAIEAALLTAADRDHLIATMRANRSLACAVVREMVARTTDPNRISTLVELAAQSCGVQALPLMADVGARSNLVPALGAMLVNEVVALRGSAAVDLLVEWRGNSGFAALAGRIESGVVAIGESVDSLRLEQRARVEPIRERSDWMRSVAQSIDTKLASQDRVREIHRHASTPAELAAVLANASTDWERIHIMARLEALGGGVSVRAVAQQLQRASSTDGPASSVGLNALAILARLSEREPIARELLVDHLASLKTTDARARVLPLIGRYGGGGLAAALRERAAATEADGWLGEVAARIAARPGSNLPEVQRELPSKSQRSER